MLQSKAGVVNKDYLAQKNLLKKTDAGELPLADLKAKTRELFETEFAAWNVLPRKVVPSTAAITSTRTKPMTRDTTVTPPMRTAARVTDRILELQSIFQNTRILIQMAIGTVPHAEQLKAIEIMGTKVAPAVRKALA